MKEIRKIGLESSSIMPLIEITPRTKPLQINIKKAINESNNKVEFFTDRYSLTEVRQQINKSFNNAIRSIEKSKILAEKIDLNNINRLMICVVKCLSEDYNYGRHETLRWSDVLYSGKISKYYNRNEFYETLNCEINKKKQKYLSLLPESQKTIYIDCKNIQPYWETPEYERDIKIKINIVNNEKSLEKFLEKFSKIMLKELNDAYMKKFKMNDVIDIYHLYSLFYDGGIKEIWSCNQKFVKEHEKYLKDINDFKSLFDKKVVTILRINK